MRAFKNRHAGQTCTVIGNGPSLKDVPDTFLDKYPTFGANRIYLRYEPTYFVAVNPLAIEQNKSEIANLECEKFLPGQFGIECHNLVSLSRKEFSLEPEEWIYEGHTVTFVSMQLAYYMGFETVLLVGVDHRYEYHGNPNEQRLMDGDDPNHFDPRYFKGQQWHNPDLERSRQAYQMADNAYRKDGRSIVNLTEGTALDVFKKGNINDY